MLSQYFCLVEDGQIKKYNVRRGAIVNNKRMGVNSPDEAYIAVGLYPIVDNKPTTTSTQKIAGISFEVGDNVINKVYNVVDIPIEEYRKSKIDKIKSDYKLLSEEPVEVDGIVWNGGDSSASAIYSAIQLALENEGTSITLWDNENINHINLDFEEAKNIAKQIAITYRNVMYERNNKISAIEDANTYEEVDTIVGG